MRARQHFLYDSRDKKPYIFKGHTNSKAGLKVGDNTVRGYQKLFAVERKGWSDFLRCVTCDWDRFFSKTTSQVTRLSDLHFSCIVVEGPLRRSYSKTYTRYPVHPEDLLNRVAEIMLWVPICFFENRKLARGATLEFLTHAKREIDRR